MFYVFLKFDIFEILWFINFKSFGLDVIRRARPLESLHETK